MYVVHVWSVQNDASYDWVSRLYAMCSRSTITIAAKNKKATIQEKISWISL